MGGLLLTLELRYVEVLGDRKEESDHLPREGGCGDLIRLSGSESMKGPVQAMLALPCVGDHHGILACCLRCSASPALGWLR